MRLGAPPFRRIDAAWPPTAVPSFAAVCYPLDTIRRQMQLTKRGVGLFTVLRSSLAAEGYMGLYRGFLPNAVKNLPNKSIRLGVYDVVKRAVESSEAAYADEVEKVAAGVPTRKGK